MTTEQKTASRELTDEERAAQLCHDLSELLKTHYGKRVTYNGDKRIAFGRTQTDLYEECFRRGLTRDEFVVCGIEPGAFDPDEEIEVSMDV